MQAAHSTIVRPGTVPTGRPSSHSTVPMRMMPSLTRLLLGRRPGFGHGDNGGQSCLPFRIVLKAMRVDLRPRRPIVIRRARTRWGQRCSALCWKLGAILTGRSWPVRDSDHARSSHIPGMTEAKQRMQVRSISRLGPRARRYSYNKVIAIQTDIYRLISVPHRISTRCQSVAARSVGSSGHFRSISV